VDYYKRERREGGKVRQIYSEREGLEGEGREVQSL